MQTLLCKVQEARKMIKIFKLQIIKIFFLHFTELERLPAGAKDFSDSNRSGLENLTRHLNGSLLSKTSMLGSLLNIVSSC